MAKTSKPLAAPRNPTRGEAAIQEFANSSLTSKQLKRRAAPLLNSTELLRDIRGLAPEDLTRFVEKVDQVGRGGSFSSRNLLPIIFAKAYPTINSQDAKFVTALGNVCSVTERLPTSAVLSAGLDKRGNIAVASGGLTDVWRGEYGGTPVAIKAFRIYPAQNLKEAKEVRIQST